MMKDFIMYIICSILDLYPLIKVNRVGYVITDNINKKKYFKIQIYIKKLTTVSLNKINKIIF